MGDAAINSALRLQPDLPEVHLAYARHLTSGCGEQNYRLAREQLAIAKRGLANSPEVFLVEAILDGRNGNLDQIIQDFKEAIPLDPVNTLSIQALADAYINVHQVSASEKEYDRLIELVPGQPVLKLEKALARIFC